MQRNFGCTFSALQGDVMDGTELYRRRRAKVVARRRREGCDSVGLMQHALSSDGEYITLAAAPKTALLRR